MAGSIVPKQHSNAGTSGASFILPYSGATAVGDYVLVWVRLNASGVTCTPPAGWTTLLNNAAQGIFLFGRILADLTQPTFTFGQSVTYQYISKPFANVDATTPLDGAVVVTSGGTQTAAALTTPSITTTGPDRRVVYMSYNLSGGYAQAPPGFAAHPLQDSRNAVGHMSSKRYAAAGATGTITSVTSDGIGYRSVALALRPATPSTAPDPSTVATAVGASVLTSYFNQRKVDRTSNNVLWACYMDNTDGATANYRFMYSLNDGATWAAGAGFAAVGTIKNYAPNMSMFIDVDDYAHVAYKDHDNGYVYYRRGTPNAGRTTWTWSTPLVLHNTSADCDAPDVVAHREGTGWRAHVVYSVRHLQTYYHPITITSGATITAGTRVGLMNFSSSANSYPSIDFHHTGDGKTVKDGTPHLYTSWVQDNVGSNLGIRFKRGVYSAGAWTFTSGVGVPIDENRNVSAGGDTHWWNCLFDGTRVIFPGVLGNGANYDMVLHERDAADNTTTTRVLLTSAAAGLAGRLTNGSATYDSDGNVYFLGRAHEDGTGTGNEYLNLRKWTRAAATLGPLTNFDETGSNGPYISAKRGGSNNRVEWVYTDGSNPWNVKYDSLVLATSGPRMMV